MSMGIGREDFPFRTCKESGSYSLKSEFDRLYDTCIYVTWDCIPFDLMPNELTLLKDAVQNENEVLAN